MSAKHAPGPWTYESDHTHRQYNIRMLGHLIGTRAEAKHICTVNNLPPHVLANRDQSTAEANARLIAAAPDLLAALDRAEAFISGFEDDDTQEGVTEMLAAIRAALANAKGE